MVTDEEFQKLKEEVKEIKQMLQEALPKVKETKTYEAISEEMIQKLAQKIGISVESLKSIFYFEEQDATLLKAVSGKSEAEKQFKATIAILAVSNECYARDSIQSQILRKKLEKVGIKSLTNLNSNLSLYREFIIPKGEPASPNFNYVITFPGIKKGFEIIKELSSV